MVSLGLPPETPVNEELGLSVPTGADGSGPVVEYKFACTTGEEWLLISAFNTLASTRRGQAPAAAGNDGLTKYSQSEFHAFVLGADVYQEIMANGITSAWLRKIMGTVWTWRSNGDDAEAAEALWLGKGKASMEAPNRETRRAKGGAAASTTRSRNSGSSTTTRKKSGKA